MEELLDVLNREVVSGEDINDISRFNSILNAIWSRHSRRLIVIAESLARVSAAIRIASVRWRSYPPPNTEISPHRPCVRCAAVRVARWAFIRLTFVPLGIAEWLTRVARVR